jgi:DNA-binding MarR family transcriptional regulator/N-acetylglutamate synthase-like GNAT family acetyltransferase
MDVIADMGPVFLGSRLKRLGERMQAGALRVLAEAGITVQPTHMPLLTALDRCDAMTVGQLADAVGMSQPGVTRSIGQLVEMGFVATDRMEGDQRQKALSLTPEGQALMARARAIVWPRVGAAVRDMCAPLEGDLLDQIAGLEAAIAEAPIDRRLGGLPAERLTIRDYSDELAGSFRDINAAWITDMFRLEDTDRDVLEHPRERIVDPGGAILFVEAAGLGIVGACALQKTGEGAFELTKMGVREEERGLKAGEFLLHAMIARAQAMGARKLYLLTNARCAAAIHLYEKAGFVHDAEIMAEYGARYARCDVAMRYRPQG